MAKQLLVSAVALSFMVVAACESSSDGDDGGGGGRGGRTGGTGGTGEAGEGGATAGASGAEALGGAGAGGRGEEGGAGGAEGGAPCSEDGSGTLDVEIVGLPAGIDAQVTVAGPGADEELEGSRTLTDVPAGTYRVTGERVIVADPIVRTVYEPSIEESSVCVADGGARTVTVTYAAIPSSGKLWSTALVGIPSSELGETGTSEEAVVVDASAGRDIAFDRDGNLWTIGATTADPPLVRFPASELGSSGTKTRDRAIDVPISCLPAIRAITFDPSGNLWVSACGGRVLRLPAESLAESGESEPDVELTGLVENGDVAFDADGNLWVVLGDTVARYDAERLEGSVSGTPDRVIASRDAEDARGVSYSHLAFDGAGNLWGFDFGANTVFQTPKTELDGTGEDTVVSSVSIVVPVTVLLNRGAFDESGGLWISYTGTRVARLTPAQLTVSSGSGAPTTPEVLVTEASLDDDLRLALFPAPAGLPLFHSLP